MPRPLRAQAAREPAPSFREPTQGGPQLVDTHARRRVRQAFTSSAYAERSQVATVAIMSAVIVAGPSTIESPG